MREIGREVGREGVREVMTITLQESVVPNSDDQGGRRSIAGLGSVTYDPSPRPKWGGLGRPRGETKAFCILAPTLPRRPHS